MLDIKTDFRNVWSATLRNLKNDWKYKFKLLLNSVYTGINLALFTVLANVVNPKEGAMPAEYGPADSSIGFMKFLFIGTWFWAIFTRPFEDTVNCLPEETQKGTIGLLLTNNVDIKTILMGRFFASLIISIILSSAIVMPFFGALGMLTIEQLKMLPLILLVFFSMMIFMLCISLWVASFSLLFKKTGVLSNVFIYGLKVATGMYFPIFGMGKSTLLLESIPVASGVDLIRDIFIVGKPVAHAAGYLPPPKDTVLWAEHISIWPGQWNATVPHWLGFVLQSQVIGVVALIFICWFALRTYIKQAKTMGTIESY
ncbi:MAG: hypothetical protein ACFFCS_07175 [Candidatus Hodarchaeota archaeon]